MILTQFTFFYYTPIHRTQIKAQTFWLQNYDFLKKKLSGNTQNFDKWVYNFWNFLVMVF